MKRLTTPAVFIGDEYLLDELDEAQLEIGYRETPCDGRLRHGCRRRKRK